MFIAISNLAIFFYLFKEKNHLNFITIAIAKRASHNCGCLSSATIVHMGHLEADIHFKYIVLS